MSADPFVPDDFDPPRKLELPDFHLVPLGVEHNESDHAAWMSSIAHIRATPGFESWGWPPLEGMSPGANREDLARHARDFAERTGFTYTVLRPGTEEVIGCLYIYPARDGGGDAQVRSWVRADVAELDAPLHAAVSRWLRERWPFERPLYAERPDGHETVLTGGNMTTVVRVGDTVRRTAGPWTPTIHAFMRHLRASGFTMVPEPLGLDERGREVISLLPGAPAQYPLPEFVWSDSTLAGVAASLRAFHDASLGFVAPPEGRWQWPAREPAEVICHNDFAPYNLMFEEGRLTGVIDLDLATPGPRVWDMAYTAYRFVPLTDPGNPDTPFHGVDVQLRRLSAFCAAYGCEGIEPADVVGCAAVRLRELVAFIEREAAAGNAAQQAVLARGDVAIYERDIAHIDQLAMTVAPP